MKLLILLSFVCFVYSDDPPEHWTEHWFEHNQTLNRVFFNNDLAVYFDNDVDKTIKWMDTYMADVWVYVKKTYGSFGTDQRLFTIYHAGKYSGGHPSTYFDSSHDYRNVIDCGSSAKNAWTAGTGNDLDLSTHEVCHIVEGAAKGVHNSPAFNIWGDSKWAEIFIYDVYKGLNRTADATRWHDLQLKSTDSFPRAGTHWFKDWFLPIYEQHGGTAALNGYFELLSKNFPQNKGASQSRPQYTRDMNHGEFFHFWSGAAKANLKALATTAFGWTDQYEKEFNQARTDFPNVKY